MEQKTKSIAMLLMIIFLGGMSRLIPHPWNFTAIGAMALLGGVRSSSKIESLVVPFLALLISDFIIGFHSVMFFTYLGFALVVMIGWWVKNHVNNKNLIFAALSSSMIFFLVSNFGVWSTQGMYPLTVLGLMECYVSALPFLGNQIFGDLFYTAVLFGAYSFAKNSILGEA